MRLGLKRSLQIIFLYLVAFLMQGSWLNVIAVFKHTPTLLLVVTVTTAYVFEEKPTAMILGAIFGLLYDLCYSTSFGPTAIALVIVSLLIYFLDNFTEKTSFLPYIACNLLSSFVFYLIIFVIYRICGNPKGIIYMLKEIPIPMAYNLVFGLLIYFFMRRRYIKDSKKFGRK